MHLADGGRGDGALVELQEKPLDRVAEVFLEHALDLLERDRANVVLQRSQLGDDVRRHDVGARREQLAELDEGRAELVEHLAQVLAPLGAGAVDRGHPLVPRDEVGQLVRLEEVAEPVLDRDLRDLGEPPQVAGGRGRHAQKCCTPPR